MTYHKSKRTHHSSKNGKLHKEFTTIMKETLHLGTKRPFFIIYPFIATIKALTGTIIYLWLSILLVKEVLKWKIWRKLLKVILTLIGSSNLERIRIEETESQYWNQYQTLNNRSESLQITLWLYKSISIIFFSTVAVNSTFAPTWSP